VKGVTVQPIDAAHYCVLPTPILAGSAIWLDQVNVIGPGRTYQGSVVNSWQNAYITGSATRATNFGFNGDLVQNCTVENISSVAFQNPGLLVNSTAADIDKTGTDFHDDAVQFTSGGALLENRIIYGLTAADRLNSQGVFGGANIPLEDVAVVNAVVNNTYGPGYGCFLFSGPTKHLYVLSSSFTGSSYWADTFIGHDVVIESTVFPGGSNLLSDGVVFR
jgi:hypothetical protein